MKKVHYSIWIYLWQLLSLVQSRQEYHEGALISHTIGSGAMNMGYYFHTLGVACENKSPGFYRIAEQANKQCLSTRGASNSVKSLPQGSMEKMCTTWRSKQACNANYARDLDDCLQNKHGTEALKFLDAFVNFACVDTLDSEGKLVDRFSKYGRAPGVFKCFPEIQDRILNCVKRDIISTTQCGHFTTVQDCFGKLYTDQDCNDPNTIIYMRDLFQYLSQSLQCPMRRTSSEDGKLPPVDSSRVPDQRWTPPQTPPPLRDEWGTPRPVPSWRGNDPQPTWYPTSTPPDGWTQQRSSPISGAGSGWNQNSVSNTWGPTSAAKGWSEKERPPPSRWNPNEPPQQIKFWGPITQPPSLEMGGWNQEKSSQEGWDSKRLPGERRGWNPPEGPPPREMGGWNPSEGPPQREREGWNPPEGPPPGEREGWNPPMGPRLSPNVMGWGQDRLQPSPPTRSWYPEDTSARGSPTYANYYENRLRTKGNDDIIESRENGPLGNEEENSEEDQTSWDENQLRRNKNDHRFRPSVKPKTKIKAAIPPYNVRYWYIPSSSTEETPNDDDIENNVPRPHEKHRHPKRQKVRTTTTTTTTLKPPSSRSPRTSNERFIYISSRNNSTSKNHDHSFGLLDTSTEFPTILEIRAVSEEVTIQPEITSSHRPRIIKRIRKKLRTTTMSSVSTESSSSSTES